MVFTQNQKRQEQAPNFGLQLAVGKDAGAGYGKGLYGDNQVIMPSAYLKVRDRRAKQHETIGKDGAWVHYVDGDRTGASSFGRNTQIESLAVHELVVQHQIHAGDRCR